MSGFVTLCVNVPVSLRILFTVRTAPVASPPGFSGTSLISVISFPMMAASSTVVVLTPNLASGPLLDSVAPSFLSIGAISLFGYLPGSWRAVAPPVTNPAAGSVSGSFVYSAAMLGAYSTC